MSFDRGLRVFSLSAFSALFLVLAPQMADAAHNNPADMCKATHIEGFNVTGEDPSDPGGEDITFGRLNVSVESGGRNCARTLALGGFHGKASYIEVKLFKCRESKEGDTCTMIRGTEKVDGPGENYRYYAGPVRLGAPGTCVGATGIIRMPYKPDRPPLEGKGKSTALFCD